MLKLEFVDKSQASYWIVDSEFGIGSSTKNQLIIEKQGIAPFHAKVFQQGGRLYVEQVAPNSKVFVNHKSISEATSISVGDVIDVSGVTLRLIDPSVRQKQHMPPQVARLTESLESSHLKPQESPATTAAIAPKEVVWRVRSVLGADKHQLVDVVDVVRVGRDPSNDIVITGSHISRRHAEFFVRNNQLLVRDLDSSNGTYVNGERTKVCSIFLGDEVAFDSHLFCVAVGRAPSVREEMAVDKTQCRPALNLEDMTLNEFELTEDSASISLDDLASVSVVYDAAEVDGEHPLQDKDKDKDKDKATVRAPAPVGTGADAWLEDAATAKRPKPSAANMYFFIFVAAILLVVLVVWFLFSDF